MTCQRKITLPLTNVFSRLESIYLLASGWLRVWGLRAQRYYFPRCTRECFFAAYLFAIRSDWGFKGGDLGLCIQIIGADSPLNAWDSEVILQLTGTRERCTSPNRLLAQAPHAPRRLHTDHISPGNSGTHMFTDRYKQKRLMVLFRSQTTSITFHIRQPYEMLKPKAFENSCDADRTLSKQSVECPCTLPHLHCILVLIYFCFQYL